MDNHNDVVHIDLSGVHTNIVMINITKPNLTAAQFCERLATVSSNISVCTYTNSAWSDTILSKNEMDDLSK